MFERLTIHYIFQAGGFVEVGAGIHFKAVTVTHCHTA